MERLVLQHDIVKVNENFTNKYYQMERKRSNCFGYKQRNITLHEGKAHKSDYGKIAEKLKIKKIV